MDPEAAPALQPSDSSPVSSPRLGNRLAAVVAATPAIEERFSACDCEVVTVNNFPELHEFQKVHRPDIGGEPVVCYVGGISASRGIDVMVDASAMTDARLVLGGSFDLPDLVDRIRALPG